MCTGLYMSQSQLVLSKKIVCCNQYPLGNKYLAVLLIFLIIFFSSLVYFLPFPTSSMAYFLLLLPLPIQLWKHINRSPSPFPSPLSCYCRITVGYHHPVLSFSLSTSFGDEMLLFLVLVIIPLSPPQPRWKHYHQSQWQSLSHNILYHHVYVVAKLLGQTFSMITLTPIDIVFFLTVKYLETTTSLPLICQRFWWNHHWHWCCTSN